MGYFFQEENPTKILEIGSYEGASACYLIDTQAKKQALEIHCIDTWEGGIEHQERRENMSAVESRFRHNTQHAIQKAPHQVDLQMHKGLSEIHLAKLLVDGKQDYFDFIYIDGSHQAPDVLYDALLSFRLLRVGGIMVFDDYLWAENIGFEHDPIRCPKPAIDAFTNIYCRKVLTLTQPLYQLYVQKISN